MRYDIIRRNGTIVAVMTVHRASFIVSPNPRTRPGAFSMTPESPFLSSECRMKQACLALVRAPVSWNV